MADNLNQQFHAAQSVTYKAYIYCLHKWYLIPTELTQAVKLLERSLESDETYKLLRKLEATNSDRFSKFPSSCDIQAERLSKALDSVTQGLQLKVEASAVPGPGRKSSLKKAIDGINIITKDLTTASDNFLRPFQHEVSAQFAQVSAQFIRQDEAYAEAYKAMGNAFLKEEFLINAENVKRHFSSTLDLSVLNLSKLPAPRMDKSFSMENLGKKWATVNIETRPVFKVLKALVASLASNDNLLIDEIPSRLPNEPTQSIVGMVNGIIQKPTIRFAVCGFMSHGKSTVINQLIGQDVLNCKQRATTSWPCVVRHVPSQKIPKLEIEPEHFRPYLESLRKSCKQSQLDTSSLEPDEQKYLEMFTGEDFNGFEDKREAVGREDVAELNAMIGHLVRLSHRFRPKDLKSRPKNLDAVWPRLSICVEGLVGVLEDLGTEYTIELVDLPGDNDNTIPIEDVKAQWQNIIQHESAGTIFVFKAEANLVDSDPMKTIKMVKQWNGTKPLIAIGTHSDQITDKNGLWTSAAEERLSKSLFRRAVKKPRIEVTSPLLYASSSHAMALLKQENLCYNDIRKTPALMVIDKLYGESKRSETFYNASTLEERLEELRAQREASKGHKIVEALQEELLVRVLNSRAHIAAGKLKERLHQAQEFHKAALHTSETSQRIRKECRAYRNNAHNFARQWYTTTTKFIETSLDSIKFSLEQTLDEANAVTASVIWKAAARSQGKRSARLSLEFKDQDAACEFLYLAEQSLKNELDKLQSTLVAKVRATTEDAWNARLKDLGASFLLDWNGGKVEGDSLRDDVLEKIREIQATPMDEAIRSLIDAKISERNRSVTQSLAKKGLAFFARDKAESDAFSAARDDGSNQERKRESIISIRLRFPKFISAQTNPSPSQSAKGTPREEKEPQIKDANEIGVEWVNHAGFLMRAPVLASAASDPITKEVWDFFNSGHSTKLDLDKVIETYKKLLVEIWHFVIAEECRKSLSGAIDLCSGIGLEHLLETVDIRVQERLGDHGYPLNPDRLDNTIVAHAACVAAKSAASILALDPTIVDGSEEGTSEEEEPQY